MPNSAIGGLVEGLLQGQAIKQQKQQDRLNQERQHATDIFNQHVQTWRETQAQEEAKRTAEQQKFDNEISTKRQANAEAEEARKVAADKQKREMSDAVINAKTDKQRQDALLKLYLTGGETLGSAAQIAGLSMGGQQAQPQQGALQGALNTLGQAGQGQAPIPNAGPLQQTPGSQPLSPIESLLQGQIPAVPRGYDTPRPPIPNAGQVAPMVQANLNQKNARTQDITKHTVMLETENLEHLQNITVKKLQAENLKEIKKLTEAKTGLTHQQEADRKAMSQVNLDLKHAQVNLTNAKIEDDHVKRDYVKAETEHIKTMDTLRAAGKDLNDLSKQGHIRDQATRAETTFRLERWKQEDNLAKMRIQYHAYENLAKIPIDQVKKPEDAARVQTAKDSIPDLASRIKDAETRIADVTAKEKEAATYSQRVTQMTSAAGVPDTKATMKAREAADKAAKEAAAAAEKTHLPPSRINLPGMDTDGTTPIFRSPPKANIPAPATRRDPKTPQVKGKTVRVGKTKRLPPRPAGMTDAEYNLVLKYTR